MHHHNYAWIKSIFLSFAVLLSFIVPVRADVAPPHPPEGSGIAPEAETTQVRMVSEVVTIEVAAKGKQSTGNALVKATFHMRNLGSVEEKMDVRFPLCARYGIAGDSPSFSNDPNDRDRFNFFPPIEDFTAVVNGNRVQVYKNNKDDVFSQNDTEIKCWANFPVVFPVGKDITIGIQYNVNSDAGFGHGTIQNYVSFSYILFTGAAWKDTIGSADIVVRLPMEANDETVYHILPEDGIISGQEIHWHYEDFEPGLERGNIGIAILQPSYWQKIQTESKNVTLHPEDGEAWGRLGKAYKEAVVMEYGIRPDATGQKMFQKSKEAYQHAVELLPNDADWHYGYAELLCHEASWHQGLFEEDGFVNCVQHLVKALRINPKHEKTLQLLRDLPESIWFAYNLSR